MEQGGRAGWVVEGGYQPQLRRLFAASNVMNIISAQQLVADKNVDSLSRDLEILMDSSSELSQPFIGTIQCFNMQLTPGT